MAQASLSFDPTTITVSRGDIVPVDILMYTGDDSVLSSDIWVTYDPAMITLSSVDNPEIEKGDLFTHVDAKYISPGKLYLYAIQNTQDAATQANGKVATVYFRAQASGQTQLRFDCVPFAQKTSQIIRNDSSLTNVINCQATRTHTSTVQIEDSASVLGVQTSRSFLSYGSTFVAIGLLLLLAVMLYIRYQRLARELNSSQ